MRTELALVGVVLAGAVLMPVSVVATAEPTALPLCPWEDPESVSPDLLPCFWDAERLGNGAGDSFVVDSGRVVHYRLPNGMWTR